MTMSPVKFKKSKDILEFRSFSVSINGFNDGQQDYNFYVSAAGVQMDCLQQRQ
jgi:hypothetical protein